MVEHPHSCRYWNPPSARTPGKLAVGAIVLFWASLTAGGQTTDLASDPAATPVPAVQEVGNCEWSFSASATGNFIPGDEDYVQPTLTADHDWLHLEARYNYEALDTASAWVGYNFSIGDEVKLDFTPIAGVVFGDFEGVAPGYEATLSWWKLQLYTEGEFVFYTDSDEDFFYNWSELSLAPVDWFRFGLAVQRTRVYETDFDIQRGFLIGVSFKQLDFTTYVLNPDDDPILMLALTFNF